MGSISQTLEWSPPGEGIARNHRNNPKQSKVLGIGIRIIDINGRDLLILASRLLCTHRELLMFQMPISRPVMASALRAEASGSTAAYPRLESSLMRF